MAEAVENNWFGNMFNAYIQYILDQWIYWIGFWMVIFGSPTWYWETIVSLALLPPDTMAHYLYFN